MSQKLTADQAEMIRVFREELPWVSKADLGREYGVHADTIRNIEKGVSFNDTTARRADRQFSDDQVREIRRLAGTGLKEQAIKVKMNLSQSRSTIRQVVTSKSYRDVV